MVIENSLLVLKKLLSEYQIALEEGLVLLESINYASDELRGVDLTIQEMLGLHKELIEATEVPLKKIHERLNNYLELFDNGIFERIISLVDSKGNGEPHEL